MTLAKLVIAMFLYVKLAKMQMMLNNFKFTRHVYFGNVELTYPCGVMRTPMVVKRQNYRPQDPNLSWLGCLLTPNGYVRVVHRIGATG